MKKTYYIPTIEIVLFETERLMGMPGSGEHGSGGGKAPRHDAVF